MGNTPAILVIDDEPNFCRIIEAKLRRSGFQVTIAPDAASGENKLSSSRYSALLLDLRLPDANGVDLLPRLRQLAPNTPIILMTAYEEERLRDRALANGAVEVLYKPFDLDHLVELIQASISN